MRIAAYVASTIASIPEVVAGAMTGDVAIEGVFSHPSGLEGSSRPMSRPPR